MAQLVFVIILPLRHRFINIFKSFEKAEIAKMDNEKELKRAGIGKLSGAVGLFCNILLAAFKIAVGFVCGAMSVIADGINNFSDAASSAITLIGFKLSEKPADREHPYGHARFEYLSGLTVAAMIIICGFELAKNSVQKILNPSPVEYSPIILQVLLFSIAVKLFMMIFFKRAGKKIQSATLFAAAADSRNDVITTLAVIVAILAEHINDVRIDGAVGAAVSLFIIYSGISLAKKTISPILGEGANPELKKKLVDYIKLQPLVLGCHDLMVHDYGPGKRYASIHVEIDKKIDPMLCHEAIDKIERDCFEAFAIHLVIHHDPVDTDDFQTIKIRTAVEDILKVRDERISIHDFRLVRHDDGKALLVFDMVLPQELQKEYTRLKESLERAVNCIDENTYETEITVDLDTDG